MEGTVQAGVKQPWGRPWEGGGSGGTICLPCGAVCVRPGVPFIHVPSALLSCARGGWQCQGPQGLPSAWGAGGCGLLTIGVLQHLTIFRLPRESPQDRGDGQQGELRIPAGTEPQGGV